MALVCKKSSPVIVPLQRLLWINNHNHNHQSVRDYRRPRHVSDDDVKAIFEEWAIDHDKVYKSLEEKERRFSLFKQQFWEVRTHNLSPDASMGKFALYRFADYTPLERRGLFGRLRPMDDMMKSLKFNYDI